jgi:broad specificity phosphatase PhoE
MAKKFSAKWWADGAWEAAAKLRKNKLYNQPYEKNELVKYLIARHGPKDASGNLCLEAIPELYANGKSLLGDFFRHRRQNRVTNLVYTSAKRTLHTGKIMLAGALGMKMPRSLEEIEEMQFPVDVRMNEDPTFSYDGVKIDFDLVKNMGQKAYFELWLAHPKAKKLATNPITSWIDAEVKLSEKVDDYTEPDRKVDSAIIVTHGGIIEPLIAYYVAGPYIVNRIKSLKEIGGQFKEGECAVVTTRRYDYDGDLCTSRYLQRGKKTYRVNLRIIDDL